MIPTGASVRPKDPVLFLIHGIGRVYEIWNDAEIQKFYDETGGKRKLQKNEVWYRALFDEAYEETPDEYDEAGELLSCGSDNLITFGADSIEELDEKTEAR